MKIKSQQFKYGLLQLKIGSKVSGLVGKGRGSITVGDKSRHPDAKYVCRCVTCKQDFADEGALAKGHPSLKDMTKDESAHVWAYFSSDPSADLEEIPKGAPPEVRKEIEERNASIQKIGLVSDEEWS